MTKRILFVLTSHTQLGSTGRRTGFHFSEMADPHQYLTERGYRIDFASPRGGVVRADGYDQNDPAQERLMESPGFRDLLASTRPVASVDQREYDAIYFVGGHGTMWDFPDDTAIQKLTTAAYEAGKPIAAVCHGPAALVNVRLSDGSYLVAGKAVAGFSDDEERAIKLEDEVPFLLETTLKERGGAYVKAGLWQEKVAVDQGLVTGQNPASALGLAKALDQLLS